MATISCTTPSPSGVIAVRTHLFLGFLFFPFIGMGLLLTTLQAVGAPLLENSAMPSDVRSRQCILKSCYISLLSPTFFYDVLGKLYFCSKELKSSLILWHYFLRDKHIALPLSRQDKYLRRLIYFL